jgi:intracellular septation protein
MLWASLAIIVVFGGLTLFLRDKTFIQWKPTVLYWLFGTVLAGGALTGRNLIKAMMSKQVALPEPVWARLNWSWAGFFACMGAANLYVAYNFSENIWVNFKLFGGIGLMLLFVLAQGLVLARYVEDKP